MSHTNLVAVPMQWLVLLRRQHRPNVDFDRPNRNWLHLYGNLDRNCDVIDGPQNDVNDDDCCCLYASVAVYGWWANCKMNPMLVVAAVMVVMMMVLMMLNDGSIHALDLIDCVALEKQFQWVH